MHWPVLFSEVSRPAEPPSEDDVAGVRDEIRPPALQGGGALELRRERARLLPDARVEDANPQEGEQADAGGDRRAR